MVMKAGGFSRKRKGAFGSALILAGAVLVSLPAGAQQNGAPATAAAVGQKIQHPEWTDRRKFKDCGQSCIYQKGNEVISVAASYGLHKMDQFTPDVLKTSDGQAEFFATMRSFCTDVEIESGQDGAIACRDRYVLVETARLNQMASAIGKNEDNVYRLQVKQKDGAVVNRNEKDVSKLRPQVSDFLKPEEVDAFVLTKDLSAEGYDQYSREELIEPKEADFTRYKKETVTTAQGQKRQLLVRDDSPKGKAAARKAYLEAMAKYKQAMEEKSLTGWAQVNGKIRKEHEKHAKRKIGAPMTTAEKEAYTRARTEAVKSVNSIIAKKNGNAAQARQESGKLDRNVAGKDEVVLKPTDNNTEYYIRWEPDELEREAFKGLDLEISGPPPGSAPAAPNSGPPASNKTAPSSSSSAPASSTSPPAAPAGAPPGEVPSEEP